MNTPSWIKATSDGVAISIHAQPNAKRSEVVGVHGDALKIKVASLPVEGQANDVLLAFLAQVFGVKARDLELRSGASSRRKVVEIKRVTIELVARVLKA